VKLAMGKIIGEGRILSGVSITCSELSCKDVCGALLECAASVDLTVPFVWASRGQVIVEQRRVDKDLRRFFENHGRRPSTVGLVSSG